MFEEYTRDAIRQTILDNMDTIVSKIEGSFASDMVAPVALELSRVYGQLEMLLNMFFVVSITGDYLTQMAFEHGVDRKLGTKATGEVTFTGEDDAIIPAGTIVLTETGLRYATTEDATIVSGTATVGIEADAIGAAYNVPAGSITLLYRWMSGVSGVTNAADVIGGTDTETDDALRVRLLDRMRAPATSGNAYHYRQWAMEVDGVGDAKIIPLWDGAGTVKVVLIGADKAPVDAAVVSAAETHIEAVRPIGATVTVVSATGLTIDVDATITYDASTTLADVQTEYEARLADYLQSLAFKGTTVSYQRIAYLLLDIDGVTGFSTLTVNGDTENIDIGTDEVATLGTVTISD